MRLHMTRIFNRGPASDDERSAEINSVRESEENRFGPFVDSDECPETINVLATDPDVEIFGDFAR